MNERLQSVSGSIRVSYAMAAACRELANREADEQRRDDLLTIEQRWLFLASNSHYDRDVLGFPWGANCDSHYG
jgi:hypothetical protein